MTKLVDTVKSWMRLGHGSIDKLKHSEQGFYQLVEKSADKNKFSPPYLDVLAQLDDENEQIFRAAVYNLTKVALNVNMYRNDIIRHLENSLDRNNRSKELQDYLISKISILK